ncbi:MAG: DMT family transporter [Clostridia bacterium]|nr:DMT family transporter [Clostridia bacterium]
MKKYLSSLLFLLAALLWGLAFSAQKDAGTLPAFTIGAVRNVFATVFILAVIPFLDKFRKNGRALIQKGKAPDFNKTEIIGGVICGFILTVATAFQQTGLGDGTDAGKAAFITALYVVIVPIITMLGGRRTPINVWISIGVAVVGFYLLCIKEDFSIVPSDALVLVCALIFALHIIVIDRFSPKCDGVRMSSIQFLSAFVFNLILALIFEGGVPITSITDKLGALLYLGICSSGIAYTLQIVGQGQADVNPAVASIILSLESVFGVLGGALLLGETMQPREYIGCAVVFVAVVLSQIEFKKRAKK